MKIGRVIAVACAILANAAVHAASPEIREVAPLALVPGAHTILTFRGSNLQTATNLWTSFGGVSHRIENTNQNTVSFDVICPPDAAGIGALQLIGPEGASNFQLVLADELKAVSAAGGHQSIASAQSIACPIAIDGALKSEQVDYYRFSARAGQTFSIEIIAHRIGSQMDPVARILTVSGREVAFCDDEGSTWRDARFRFTAPNQGDYILAVHDVGYGGGNNFDYRLRFGDDPVVWYTFPLADPAEPAAPFQEIGLTESRPSHRDSPANPPGIPWLSAWPSLAEFEPNDSPSQAQPFGLPVILNGRIEKSGDHDLFSFKVEKGQKLVFQSQTRSLGSPCDLVLRVKKPDGAILAQSDSTKPDDAALTNQFSEAGTFLLEISELSGASDPGVPYRVKAFVFEPTVSLSTETHRIEAAPGKIATIKVQCVRHEYDGPVSLELTPPIEGCALEGNLIAGKQNETELKFKIPEKWTPAAFAHCRITGRTENGSRPIGVSTKPALRKAFPLMLNPPSRLDGLISITAKKE